MLLKAQANAFTLFVYTCLPCVQGTLQMYVAQERLLLYLQTAKFLLEKLSHASVDISCTDFCSNELAPGYLES